MQFASTVTDNDIATQTPTRKPRIGTKTKTLKTKTKHHHKPKPTEKKEPDYSCYAKYYGWGYEYRISGAHFGSKDKLRDVADHCGIVTKWKWSESHSPQGYSWYAQFRLPMWGRRKCVRKALHKAGGPDKKCGGGVLGTLRHEAW